MKMIDDRCLIGAIDMHVHCYPDYVPRYADALSLAEEAAAAGMRGVVIKSHLLPTIGSAYIVNQLVPGTTIFGSVALNAPSGGLNPRTVIANAKAGAKMFWLPTIDAAFGDKKAREDHWIQNYNNGGNFGRKIEYINLLNSDGALKPEGKEIIEICKEYRVCLASGHVSPEEALAVAKYAEEIGYAQFEVTHPNIWEEYTIEKMRELADLGATLAIAYGCTMPHNGGVHPGKLVTIVKEVGAERCTMITDFGQVYSPSPIEGFRVYRSIMKRFGCTEEELDLMMKTNPARLLALDD